MALIAAFKHGEPWDSLSGAKPVSTERSGNETVERFADGSIRVTSIEAPGARSAQARSGMMGAMAVTGCHKLPDKNGWIRRSDCLVKVSNMAMWMEFTADYSVKAGAGRIDGARHPGVGILAGGYSNVKLSISRATSSGNAPATARISATAWIGPFKDIPVYKGTAWMQMNVLTSAWTTNN